MDEAGAKRARFFVETFGAMHVPVIGHRVALLKPKGVEGKRPFYMADVYSSRELADRFEASCMMRNQGEKAVMLARARGFYPVNVDGITLVRSETPLFGTHDQRPTEGAAGQGDS